MKLEVMKMNQLNTAKRAQIIGCLVEGNSLRATARMCDVAFNTVLKFIPEIGEVCSEYQDRVFRNLKCKRIQCDEIWSFCCTSPASDEFDLLNQAYRSFKTGASQAKKKSLNSL